MPNDYFKFKQFIVYQNNSAMKVCTDACLLGAFVANAKVKSQKSKRPPGEKLKALDIGAGTGLLSLMLAQKIDAIIDAIEMDEHSAQQARENFVASSWKDRLHVHHTSIQVFTNQLINPNNSVGAQPSTNQLTYDLIISNPPFFVNALQSNNQQKNNAKHTATLSFGELAYAINTLLSHDGEAFIMLPPVEMSLLEKEMHNLQLFPQHKLFVRQTPRHEPFRAIALFTRQKNCHPLFEEMTIRNEDQNHSAAFTALLKDYYLYL